MADKQYEEVLGRTRATEPHPDHLNSFEYHVIQKSLLDLSDRLDKLEAGGGKETVKTEEPFLFQVGDRVRVLTDHPANVYEVKPSNLSHFSLSVGGSSYTPDGKYQISDTHSHLELVERPEVKTEEPFLFQVGDKVNIKGVKDIDVNSIHTVQANPFVESNKTHPLLAGGYFFTKGGKSERDTARELTLVERPEVKTEEPPFKVGDVGYFYDAGRTVLYGRLFSIVEGKYVHIDMGPCYSCFSLTPPQLDEHNRAIVNG